MFFSEDSRAQHRLTRYLYHCTYMLCYVTVAVLISHCAPPSSSDSTSVTVKHTYSTWSTQELDSVASAWLIKRFVDPEAVFRFFSDGTLISEGVSFNTPDGTFTRTHNQTSYEQIIAAYALKDEALIAIGAVVHAIEIDYWLGSDNSLVAEVDAEIQAIIQRAVDPAKIYEESFVYLDGLYASLHNPSTQAANMSTK